jgi:BASS family bile acid:Na+ symporter
VVSGASLSAWDILKSLLALVLIPLVVGLLARARYPEHAQDWTAGLVKVANLALVIALAAGIAVNWAAIVGMFGSWVLVASLIIIAVGVLLGALVGGRDPARIALLDFVLPLLLAIEVGRRVNRQARTPRPRDVAQP